MGPGRLHDDARPRQCGRGGQPELGRILLGWQPGDVHERVRVLGPARGTVSFTDATADNTALGNENPAALMMVSANDVTEATPSALTGGTAFTVTWDSSGTSAAAVPAPPATGPAPGSGGIPGRHHHHHWFDG
jgi:hypothetical protein